MGMSWVTLHTITVLLQVRARLGMTSTAARTLEQTKSSMPTHLFTTEIVVTEFNIHAGVVPSGKAHFHWLFPDRHIAFNLCLIMTVQTYNSVAMHFDVGA